MTYDDIIEIIDDVKLWSANNLMRPAAISITTTTPPITSCLTHLDLAMISDDDEGLYTVKKNYEYAPRMYDDDIAAVVNGTNITTLSKLIKEVVIDYVTP